MKQQATFRPTFPLISVAELELTGCGRQDRWEQPSSTSQDRCLRRHKLHLDHRYPTVGCRWGQAPAGNPGALGSRLRLVQFICLQELLIHTRAPEVNLAASAFGGPRGQGAGGDAGCRARGPLRLPLASATPATLSEGAEAPTLQHTPSPLRPKPPSFQCWRVVRSTEKYESWPGLNNVADELLKPLITRALRAWALTWP